MDCSAKGFEWICHSDHTRNILAFRRLNRAGDELIVLVNFSPVIREDYYIGVPSEGTYKEIFNTDLKKFGGSGIRNRKLPKAKTGQMHGYDQYISVTLPPLSTLIFQPVKQNGMKI